MSKELGRLFSHEMGRRDLLRYTGMGVGVSAALAACKKASDTASQQPGASRAPIEQEPGGLQVFDWSGYGNGDYYPGKERLSSGSSTRRRRAIPRSSSSSRTTMPGSPRWRPGRTTTSSIRARTDSSDYVDIGGACSPGTRPQIPNFSDLNPSCRSSARSTASSTSSLRTGGSSRPCTAPTRSSRQEDSWSLLFDDRYSGKISWIDTLEMLVDRGLPSGCLEPVGDDRRRTRADADFLISKKRSREVLLEPVLRAVPGVQA